jgi:hypothetical protein
MFKNYMTMDENFNTIQARIVCSNDDDNDNAHHAPTAFNHASNANNITDTSIVLVTFPLLKIRDQCEDEDFIGPDGHANPLPEGFSVAPRTAVHVSRHVNTANHEANNDDATDGNESSICDGTYGKEDYSNEEDNDYSFAYASSSPCTTMSNNCNAVCSTSNAINDSNNCIAVGGSDDDITSLSCTNQSLQPNVSASESSSFIGPNRNPKRNAHLKVKSFDIGEEPSDGENECSISDERVSSVGGGSHSITSRPDLSKSITKSSFDGVSRQLVLGQSSIGPVLNRHHAAPPREDSLQRNLGAPKTL